MALNPTATDAKKLRGVLDPDWKKLPKDQLAELDAVCQDALVEAFKVYEGKAKFVVVGQLYYSAGQELKHWDPAVDRVALGPFPSEATARSALVSLSGQAEFRCWALPYWQSTPAAWKKSRKAQMLEELPPEPKPGIVLAEESRLDALGTCGLDVLDEVSMEFVPCIRLPDHAGACFCRIPNMGDQLAETDFEDHTSGPDRPIALRGATMWPPEQEDT